MKFLRAVFVSPDGKVRAGWVILTFILVSAALSALHGVVVHKLGIRSTGRGRLPLWEAANSTAQLITALLATWAAMRLGRQKFGDAFLADDRFARRLGGGVLAGVAIVSAAAVVPLLAGELAFAGPSERAGAVASSMGQQVLMLLPAATWEEVLTRGLMLQQLARAFAGLVAFVMGRLLASSNWALARRIGATFAIGLTGLSFALMHAGNPEATAFGLANIALVGFVFGAITVRQGSIWGAVGLHIGWNVCLAVFWGLPVSGFDFGLSLLEPTKVGDPLWTGGAFGPEASAVTTVVLSGTLLAVLRMPVRHVANPGVLGPAVRPPLPAPETGTGPIAAS